MHIETKLDPRVERTRALIEQAFLDLLENTSLQSVSVGEIARNAGVNRATFYAHFEDKYALFSHVVRRTFGETLHDHLSPAQEYSPKNMASLVQATCNYFGYLNSQCPPSERLHRPVAETEVQTLLYETLCRWFPTANSNPLVNEENYPALFLSWAIFGSVLQTIGSSLTVDVEAVAAQVNAQVSCFVKTLGS